MARKFTGAVCAVSFASTFFTLSGFASTDRQLDAHDHGHALLNIAISDSDVFLELISPAVNVVGFEHEPETEAEHETVTAAVAQLNDGEMMFLFNDAAKCELQESDVESALLDGGEAHGDEDRDDEAHGEKDHDDEAHGEKDHDDEVHGEKDHDDDEVHGEKDHDDEAHGEKDHDDEAHGEKDHDDEAHGEKDHDDEAHGEKDHDDEAHGDKDHDAHDDEHGDTHSEFHVTWAFSCSSIGKLDAIETTLLQQFPGFEEIDVSVVGDNGQTSVELSPGNAKIEL